MVGAQCAVGYADARVVTADRQLLGRGGEYLRDRELSPPSTDAHRLQRRGYCAQCRQVVTNQLLQIRGEQYLE